MCYSKFVKNRTVFFPGLVGVGWMPLLLPSSLLHSVLVALEPWTGAQCAFAAKAFNKNGYSFMIAHREFRRDFGIHRNHAVSSVHVIKTWVQNFEATGSVLKKKSGSVITAHTPESVVVVREVIERSPCWSVCRHATSLGLSAASV
jgi:transposase